MAQISKCKQMFLKHLKRATPLLFPESRRLQVTLCPNSAKGKTPTPFGVNFQEKCNSPFVGFPQVAGDVRDQVVPRIRAGQGANSRARARRDSHVPLPRWAQGELVVATVGRRLFLFTALAAGWPRCTGGGGAMGGRGERWWVHLAIRPLSLRLTATPEERAAGAATSTRPRSASLWNLASPRPCRWR